MGISATKIGVTSGVALGVKTDIDNHGNFQTFYTHTEARKS
jgi:hypothetical protein